ncbi:CapA family protein [Actinophytocola sp.]|jgi:poly-gamma-glutamate synthesis protein (capsule biosynthesis protein)|uniref:CapA family protein n=1 Tax=Actinophytocola sp. TaxID=1872138 RepID=UPI002ED9DC59
MTQSGFSLAAVGDLVPSRRLPAELSTGFKATADYLSTADVTFGDLEIPLSTGGAPREKWITFRASPDLAEDLAGLRFDVLSLANNHSLDYGPEALFDTMRELDAVEVRHLGAGRDLAASGEPVVIDVNGVSVGFLAWSCLLPTGAAASDTRPGLAPLHVHTAYELDAYLVMEEPGNPPVVRTRIDEADLARAVESITALRDEVDFLVVSVHWGYGAGENLAEYQRPLGHAIVDAGADVVLGNHVHAIHGVEVYRGKAILYSPGNFIAQQPREGLSEGAIAILDEMSRDGYLAWLDVAPGGGYTLRLVPVTGNADGLPEVVDGPDWERIAERIERLSARLGTPVSRDGGYVTVHGTEGVA